MQCLLDSMVGDVNLFITQPDAESTVPMTTAELDVMIAGEITWSTVTGGAGGGGGGVSIVDPLSNVYIYIYIYIYIC